MRLFFYIVCLFLGTHAQGDHSNDPAARAARAREQIEQVGPLQLPASSIVLRTTRGFSQRNSQLCWSFAAMNILETNFLEQNSSVDSSEVELSRW